MNSPDFRHGYLRIPLALWLDLYCRGRLTRRQLQVVSVIIRESWGWRSRDGRVQLWTRSLPTPQLAELTGLAPSHLRTTISQLLAAGVLLRRGDRYQFVAGPQMWITTAGPALKRTANAPDRSALRTQSVLLAPGLKKRKIGNRKSEAGAVQPDAPVDNFSFVLQPELSKAAPAARLVRPAADRLADVVAAFVGTLTAEQAEELRSWICEEGVHAVWKALEPAFRQGASVARHALLQALLSRQEKPAR